MSYEQVSSWYAVVVFTIVLNITLQKFTKAYFRHNMLFISNNGVNYNFARLFIGKYTNAVSVLEISIVTA